MRLTCFAAGSSGACLLIRRIGRGDRLRVTMARQ